MVTSTKLEPSIQTGWWLLPADQLLPTVWKARQRVLLCTSLFAILGVVTAFLIPQEFRAEARIIPEMNTSAGSLFKRLSSVAAFADLDLSSTEGMDAVRPDLYPNVVQSTPFALYLIGQTVYPSDGSATTVGQLLLPDSTGWSLRKWLSYKKAIAIRPVSNRLKGTVRLSDRQQELVEEIGERVSAKLDTRSGIITIVSRMPDAEVAAQVAQAAMTYLTLYVTDYRTEKARADFAFYSRQLAEARQRFQDAQFKVFQYNDNHRHVVLQTVGMERYRLDADVTTAETVFTELSRQYEQAKLKVQEQTPIFKVLEPPKVPHQRTSPKRTMILLGFILLGLMVSVLSALVGQ
ncbi:MULTISPECIES: GNVR domain-containing protein [unclassified Spirosoma]|uniref:GNVR domain-containing protein n=1 Tax=unclassified Spirosoma TaxID=2621999 RepID=UPI000964FB01|nr:MULTISPECIES: GNVR domain-containing protein [unclassified Spirosoma]MBN8826817.1 lipopolysaccharide biosynthesis protein [Spirosoma sp.]OJW73611.1 MAG: lipopolysaccharide biosynthesis protein [Spirosoma sp. 48-14]